MPPQTAHSKFPNSLLYVHCGLFDPTLSLRLTCNGLHSDAHIHANGCDLLVVAYFNVYCNPALNSRTCSLQFQHLACCNCISFLSNAASATQQAPRRKLHFRVCFIKHLHVYTETSCASQVACCVISRSCDGL